MNRFKSIYYEQPVHIMISPGEDRIVAAQRKVVELCHEVYGCDFQALDNLFIRFLFDDYAVDTFARIDGWGHLHIFEFSDFGHNMSIKAIIPISSIFDNFENLVRYSHRQTQNNHIDEMVIEWNYNKLPFESGDYLTIFSELDIFDGKFADPSYGFLRYDANHAEWNIKSSIKVHAWAKLPKIFIKPLL